MSRAITVKNSEQIIRNAKPCKRELIEIGRKKLGNQEILSQTKHRSQHGTWSLEYGKIRKKYLACPAQLYKSGVQSQLEFGKYKNNTSNSLQKPTPFNTGIRKIRKRTPDIHTLFKSTKTESIRRHWNSENTKKNT